MKQKLKYFFRSLLNLNQPKICPNCGSQGHVVVDAKYFVTKLLKCNNCLLQYRHPTDSVAFLENFYQAEYKANYSTETYTITDFPTATALESQMKKNFPDKRDHSGYASALLKKNTGRVLDYGASWGYSVYQLNKAGFNAEGFEISKVRAEFGKKLGVTIYTQHDDVPGSLDMIMSNHVIEHLSIISEFINFAKLKLYGDGIFMAFCPNGSDVYRKREPDIFHVNWGFLHPNYLDVKYASRLFRNNPYLILTGDWDYNIEELAQWDGVSQCIGTKKDGKELLIISKPNINIVHS